MNAWRWVDPRIEAVRATNLRAYLLGRGWRLRPYPRPETLVFEGPPDDDGEPIVQLMPSSEQASDFRQRIDELITSLSVIEDRHPVEVLNDILRPRTPEHLPSPVGLDGAGTAVAAAEGRA